MMGKSKLNSKGVSSLTLALALSTPPISPAIDTFRDEIIIQARTVGDGDIT